MTPAATYLTTKYEVGEGYQMPKVGDDDACTPRLKMEFWLVEAYIEYSGCKSPARPSTSANSSSSRYDDRLLEAAFEFAMSLTESGKLKPRRSATKSGLPSETRCVYSYAACVCIEKTKSSSFHALPISHLDLAERLDKCAAADVEQDGSVGARTGRFHPPQAHQQAGVSCGAVCEDQQYIESKPKNEGPVELVTEDVVRDW
ncbi:hypothetical protein F4818DRAFT_437821 [Hypoxylon cercidicola]|nr:hypothetical protein F4818DRAFT_437821 [Hypoxylon cercidicola]